MKSTGSFVPAASFRHYGQSVRVVDFLENDGLGINLTKEVRDGILNHSKGSVDIIFTADGGNKTLEGQVVRIADRIAYINHDTDDAIRAGVLSEAGLPERCISVLGGRHSQRIATMVIDLVENSRDKFELSMSDDVLNGYERIERFFVCKRLWSASVRHGRRRTAKSRSSGEGVVQILHGTSGAAPGVALVRDIGGRIASARRMRFHSGDD